MTQKLDLNKLLPNVLRDETLSSIVSNLFNRFVSEEQSVFVAGRVGKKQESYEAEISAPNLEYELNSIIPAIYIKTGTEEQVFTFADLLNKLKSLNCNVDNLKEWFAEQNFNFTPPIDFDKFVNFSNYFWLGDYASISTKLTATWNQTLDPEYYVIKRPPFNNADKYPARLATTRNIRLHGADRIANNSDFETFTITFTTNSDFFISGSEGGCLIRKINDAVGSEIITDQNNTITLNSTHPNIETRFRVFSPQFGTHNTDFGLQDPFIANDPLFDFSITTGVSSFKTGDVFEIQIKYFTSEIYVSFNAIDNIPLGRGALDKVISTAQLMFIDGQRIRNGDRILVTQQNDPSENGIYRASGLKWHRVIDASIDEYLPLNSRVYINEGTLNSRSIFTLSNKGTIIRPNNFVDMTFIRTATNVENFINQWQEFNYWYHKDFITRELGITDFSRVVQAKRPIIEYNYNLQLNEYTHNGLPCDALTQNANHIPQRKTKFNQIPLFDLFYYDGTHSRKVSSIFFYVEDQDFSIDTILQRRVKLTPNADYVFGIGITDNKNRLLFFKDEKFKTIWEPGAAHAYIENIFLNNQLTSNISISTISQIADNQLWTIKCIDINTFSVHGSRSGLLNPNAQVGIIYNTSDFTFTILPSTYAIGDSFTFYVRNKVSPRFVKKLDGNIVNSSEFSIEDGGVWLTPLRMFQNLKRELHTEINFADLTNHFRSVIKTQDGFRGSSFGNNNFRNLDTNLGYGGRIREFDNNYPLLVSMLCQQNISPLSIISFGERQYYLALASIDTFISNDLSEFISSNSSLALPNIDITHPHIIKLLDKFENIRSLDTNLKNVFSDTIAKIKNWPITLPMMGIINAIRPHIGFDLELGIDVIVHHDGHRTPLAIDTDELNSQIVRTPVKRSDGTITPGIFKANTPPLPPTHNLYARQLWLETNSRQVFIFDVISDSNIAPITGVVGEYWFNRSTTTLYEWNSIAQSWILSTVPIQDMWKPFSISTIRNSLILAIEQRLFDSVHIVRTILGPTININSINHLPNIREYQQIELAKFATKYSYDIFGTDFNQSDAFTWNYSQVTIPGVTPNTARWFDIYKSYFDQPGLTLPTIRPNIEPWRLLNFAIKPSNWDALFANTNVANELLRIPNARVVAEQNILLFGLQSIDNILLNTGDRVLVIGQTNTINNGVYIVSVGAWSRSLDNLQNGTTISISDGMYRKQTTWAVISNNPIIPNISQIEISQVRYWSDAMWLYIKTQRPNLKLCVNPFTDVLLPPYVSSVDAISSAEALLNVIPVGITNRYEFGQNGPTEIIWKKSLEYLYGLTRSYFKNNPLDFLDKTWGYTYIQGDDKFSSPAVLPSGIRLERNLSNNLPHNKFLLHGDKLHNINEISNIRQNFTSLSLSWLNAVTFEFIVDFIENNNLTIFGVYSNGQFVQNIVEGEPFTVSHNGATINAILDDNGIPFNIGDKIKIQFYDPIIIIEPIENDEEYCIGCVTKGGRPLQQQTLTGKMPTFDFIPAKTNKFLGLGQLFTNLLRYNNIDTQYSIAVNAYNKWDIKLAHRFGALIRPDSLRINTNLGLLPSTAFNIVLNKSTNIDSRWISAIRIQLVEMGQKVLNEFGLWVPRTDGSDWTFRIEVYNSLNPTIDYYSLNTTGDFQTFFALQKQSTNLEWKRYINKGVLNKNAPMPMTITGVQNIINILFGYITRLEELGFFINEFDNIITDDETGRNLNWQLEIEKFIDRVFRGVSAGEGHILNPFMRTLYLKTPQGIMSSISENNFFDEHISTSIFDIIGDNIALKKLAVIRTDEQTAIHSEIPIYSAHLFTDEYQHIMLFSERISEETNSAPLFIPFLGMAIDSAYLSYNRNENIDGKPIFNGFFLSGNNIKRNIVSSVDLIGKYYDANRTFEEPETARNAMALLGFSKKDYFNKINVSDATQFNFWRGLIQSKGTNLSIDAFINYKKFYDASVDEYWAYKLATYGDNNEYSQPEIKINSNDVTQKFVQFQFYTEGDNIDKLDLSIQIERNDSNRWFSIDDLGKGLKFETLQISEDIEAQEPGYFTLKNIYHIDENIRPKIEIQHGQNYQPVSNNEARIISTNLIKINVAGKYRIHGYTWLNPTKFSPVKLFDYVNKVMIQEISLWHPAIGIHAHEPLQIINIIEKYDPARYNYSIQTTNNFNYQPLKPWGQKEVGRVWWDISNLGYIPYYDTTIYPQRQDRNNRWGLLTEWATIDLYEWIESTVPPNEYDEKSLREEGRIDIPIEIRASGKAASKEYYKRNRNIQIRPIAWSMGGANSNLVHPAFQSHEMRTVFVTNNMIYPDRGSLEQFNLIAGNRFGGWDIGNSKPIGEVELSSTRIFNIGNSFELNNPNFGGSQNLSFDINMTIIQQGLFNTPIGKIIFTKQEINIDDIELIRIRISDENNNFQDADIQDWIASPIGTTQIINFTDFGIRLLLTRRISTTISSIEIANIICNDTNDIVIREGILFNKIIDLPNQEKFINDPADPEYPTQEFEWRVWSIPSQRDLSLDLAYPKNKWKPYIGDWIDIEITPDLISTMQDERSTLMLKDKSIINKFNIEWSEWQLLVTSKLEKISDGNSNVTFLQSEFILDENELININRLQVFVNGIQLSPNPQFGYTIQFNNTAQQEEVIINNLFPEGSRVLLVYLRYNPTSEELQFDPEIQDNLQIQTQYKVDYQYTKIDERGENGAIIGSKYYFWVSDKTTLAKNKNLSIARAKDILTDGPTTFMIFSRLLKEQNNVYFDSCAITGLQKFITKNDTYKLRFIRNFILRHDPEQLKLKNIHNEWILIRRGQLSRIPEQLWNLITDAAAGQDFMGNLLPNQIRIDYDKRFNTRTRFGFEPGQIFADSELVKMSIRNIILNTTLRIKVGNKEIIDYILALNFNESDKWFSTPELARQTMNIIWNTAKPTQINEIFFAVLEDALANNFEFSDIFKTSFITVQSSTQMEQLQQLEIEDGIF